MSPSIFSVFKKACIFIELLSVSWIMATVTGYLLIKTEKTVQDNFSLFVLTVNCLEIHKLKL